jgi:uncharacterized membrane protein
MSNSCGATELGQLSLGRLERVSDFVHAFALLALLLTFQFLPSDVDDAQVGPLLLNQVEAWVGFVIGFLIIAYYWISHQKHFSYYVRTNDGHTWLELLYLVAVAVVPLGNQAISVIPVNSWVMLVVSLDIMFVGVMQYFAWAYATKNDRLVHPDSLDAATRSAMGKEALMLPAAAVGAIAGFFYPPLWYVVLILGPVMLSARKK